MALPINVLRKLRIKQVRTYLSDFPFKNRLLGFEESDDDDLELAIDMSIDRFNNAEVPQTEFDLTNFPSLTILIYGAIIELLQMKGIWYSRNRLNYSNGGIQVAINDKAPEYMKWAGSIAQTYDRLTVNKKMSINIGAGWGGVPSEYSSTDYWY